MKFWYVGSNMSHNVNYHCILNKEVVINSIAALQGHLRQPWEQYEKCLDKIIPLFLFYNTYNNNFFFIFSNKWSFMPCNAIPSAHDNSLVAI